MLSIKNVARKMQITETTLRVAMQVGQCPFGRAIQSGKGKRFNYVFFEPLVRLYVGEIEGMLPETEAERESRLAVAAKALQSPPPITTSTIPCMKYESLKEQAEREMQREGVSRVFVPARGVVCK